LERGAMPDQGLSPTRSVWRFHVPRIWIRSINPRVKRVKRKSQNLVKIFRERLYLVVQLPESGRCKSLQNLAPSTEVLANQNPCLILRFFRGA
jgi:hypothetical protein